MCTFFLFHFIIDGENQVWVIENQSSLSSTKQEPLFYMISCSIFLATSCLWQDSGNEKGKEPDKKEDCPYFRPSRRCSFIVECKRCYFYMQTTNISGLFIPKSPFLFWPVCLFCLSRSWSHTSKNGRTCRYSRAGQGRTWILEENTTGAHKPCLDPTMHRGRLVSQSFTWLT
jgi:hypothetical protein